MKDLLIQAGPWIVVAGLILLPGVFALVKREQIIAAIRRITPDPLDDLATRAAADAYKVVEQKMRKLAEKSDEERLAMAKRYFKALLDFYRHGKVSDLVGEAFIELELYWQHRPENAPAVTAGSEGVPLAESESVP